MTSLQNNFSIPTQEISGRNGETYTVRKASEGDVAATTLLIRKAYSYWVEQGVPVSPARQTEQKTREHLIDGGFVVENDAGELIGTFTLEEAEIAGKGDRWLVHYSNPIDKIEYSRKKNEGMDPGNRKKLVFKKLAVNPMIARNGLGRRLYDIAEEYGRVNGYGGVLLETVVEAEWLYSWYGDMGFEVIGGVVFDGSQFETLLLFKNIL